MFTANTGTLYCFRANLRLTWTLRRGSSKLLSRRQSFKPPPATKAAGFLARLKALLHLSRRSAPPGPPPGAMAAIPWLTALSPGRYLSPQPERWRSLTSMGQPAGAGAEGALAPEKGIPRRSRRRPGPWWPERSAPRHTGGCWRRVPGICVRWRAEKEERRRIRWRKDELECSIFKVIFDIHFECWNLKFEIVFLSEFIKC